MYLPRCSQIKATGRSNRIMTDINVPSDEEISKGYESDNPDEDKWDNMVVCSFEIVAYFYMQE
jgi:hypothetical protein